MNKQQPIFTEQTECQDCYKCVRSCPVKAIKIEQGVASVMPELCIYCGTCVNICPAGAKQVRDDRARVKYLLRQEKQVIVSLAPSWLSEFQGVSAPTLIAAIKTLGFYGVSETALGAQEVSAHVAGLLADAAEPRCWVSSACPVVVEYVKKYHPEHIAALTGLVSPVIAHSLLLKQTYGAQCKIVFIGPCIAKKREGDDSHGLLSAVLTFADLRQWLEDERIALQTLQPAPTDVFIPTAAEEGALYPIDGGMIAGIKAHCAINDARCVSLSGLENVIDGLRSLALLAGRERLFVELLACSGGCINGPKTHDRYATIPKRMAVIGQARYPGAAIPRRPAIPIDVLFEAETRPEQIVSDEQIRVVLRQTGKFAEDDELNCGGCGYDSCREFAIAVLAQKAETMMCVTYMRQLANKKANKLIRTMPSAVVIVDHDLRIIECNRHFASLAGEDVEGIYQVHEGMGGAVLEKILPISHLFEQVLASDEDILEKDIQIRGRVLKCSLFSIERGRIVGCILNDITEPVLKKDEITQRAKQVIRKNLKTVQQIAYLLGENAAETEMTLTSIIEAFNPDKTK